MIRKETLLKTDFLADKAVSDLIDKCYKYQNHPQDLLICQQHGSILELNKIKSFIIEPADDGLSSFSHLNFINCMAKTFLTESTNPFVYSNEDEKSKIAKLNKGETITLVGTVNSFIEVDEVNHTKNVALTGCSLAD